MGATYLRGGIPHVKNGTAETGAAQQYRIKPGVANWCHFLNTGAESILLSFSEEDATAGVGITVPSGLGASGNPLSLPIEMQDFWVKSTGVGASTWQLLALLRRG